MTWGWVDELDAHSVFEYDWSVNPVISGIIESAVDLVGDKILNANYWVVVGFIERGDGGPDRYNTRTQQITLDARF